MIRAQLMQAAQPTILCAVICFVLIFFQIRDGYPQTQSNVTTPKGSTVTAYITPEISSYLRAYYDSHYYTSNRSFIGYFSDGYSSSGRFNCHGYAWHMVEGGSPRWIGAYATTDEDIYMTDGSYVQVCSEMYPGKVSWASGDHSAITTSTPGRWISKWGSAPLVEHDWNDSPYGTTNLKYYVSTNVSGSSSVLCSETRTLSAPSIVGATYTWSVNSSLLSILSGQGSHQVTVQCSGSSFGQGWVEVQITTPCSSGSSTSKKFNFWVGIPDTPGSIIGDPSPGPGSVKAYQAVAAGASSMSWILPYCYGCSQPWGFYSGQNSTQMMANVGDSAGYVQAMGNNACGEGGVSLLYVTPSGGSDPCPFVYPNPASEELVLEWRTDAGGEISGETEGYEFDIYDSRGMKVLSGNSRSSLYRIDIRGLKNGLYYIHILDSKGLVRKQIKIEK